MQKAEAYASAIRAALAYTRRTQEDLAASIGIHPETLGRKLRRPGSLTLDELIAADRAIRWTAFIQEEKRR